MNSQTICLQFFLMRWGKWEDRKPQLANEIHPKGIGVGLTSQQGSQEDEGSVLLFNVRSCDVQLHHSQTTASANVWICSWWRRRIRLCLWLTVGLQSDGLLPSDGPFTHWVIRPATPTFSPSASWFRRNTETRCLVTDDILRFHNCALQIVLQQDTRVFQQERKIYI